MKSWIWYVVAVVLPLAVFAPFRESDIAQLKPIELVYIQCSAEGVRVETDTGDFGMGPDLNAAFVDLKACANGDVFLETADYLLVSPEGAVLLPQLAEYLRPACQVCVIVGNVDLEKTAEWLAAHKPDITLLDYHIRPQALPVCVAEEGRMYYDG